MALILNIETATGICSASLAEDGKTIAIREAEEERSHASVLAVFIEELLNETGITATGLDAIAVSKGPGSYTGLRIGVSTAKGICYSAGKPLIGIETLLSMAWGMANLYIKDQPVHKNTLLCPMIDARRMEVYTALYNSGGKKVCDTRAVIINEKSYSDLLEKGKIIFFGDGAGKCRNTIKSQNALFVDGISTSARYMEQLSEERFRKGEIEDTAYFEPYYLKNFIAGKPTKKLH